MISLKNTILKFYYKCKGNNIRFASGVFVDSKCTIDSNVFMGANVSFKMSSIGDHSYIANDSYINRTIIGKYCSIGPHVVTAIGSHPTREYVSTHPAFYSKSDESILGYSYVKSDRYDEYPGYETGNGTKSIIIGNDVWIGANATIIEKTRIGNGAIIGAGAVVKGDVPPYAIVTGNPASVQKYRFDREKITYLEKTKWWDMRENELLEKAEVFSNIELFIGD